MHESEWARNSIGKVPPSPLSTKALGRDMRIISLEAASWNGPAHDQKTLEETRAMA